jgi:two-component system sensor histidine kinase QseC
MNLPRSLQGRLLVLVVGLVMAVWLATAVMTWFDVRHELDELLDSHLAQAAALLVVQQAREVEDDDHHVDAPTLHRYAPKVAFQVWHEGRLALRSANAPAEPMTPGGKRFATGFETLRIDGTAWRVFAAHGAERDVQVYVGEQVGSRASIAWAVLRSMLWPMAAALPLLALAAWFAVHRGVAPLSKLGRTLAVRDPRATEPVVMDGAPSEMTPMLDALNGLFGRIGALNESERRFTADAAHELRTPIAAIRAHAQVAQGEADDELRRHALQATLEGCDRATRLAEQLLTLSRLEAGAAPTLSPVDLSALVQRVLAEVAPKAVQKRQTLAFDGAERCLVPGDEALLAVLVRNLVENAIGYSPPNATVKVGVAGRDKQVRLMVEDSGPGMAEADLARLGERFFRVLGSAQSGGGLGWSILRRVASVHQADVRAGRSETLGGLQVVVDLPLHA